MTDRTNFKCTCGADCDLADETCSKYVKPIGGTPSGEWIHSCWTHREELTARCEHPIYPPTAWDWDSPTIMAVKENAEA